MRRQAQVRNSNFVNSVRGLLCFIVMGGCVSVTPEEREAKLRSQKIDRDIRVAARDYENTIKILLLGKLM